MLWDKISTLGSSMPIDPRGVRYRELAFQVVQSALRDARSEQHEVSWPARYWLVFDPLANYLLDILGMDQDRLIGWVRELVRVEQEACNGTEEKATSEGGP